MTTHAKADTPMRTIYLLRHCRPILLPGGKRYLGQSDPPLSTEGVRQAEQWRAFFCSFPLTAIHCSDLQRALQTARIAFGHHGMPITPSPALREVNLGQWEGRLFTTVRQTDPHGYASRGKDPAGHCPAGGESFQDLYDRVVPAFQSIVATTTHDIAVVGHAGVNRVLLCHLLGSPLAHLFRYGQNHGGLNIIQIRSGKYRVQAVNIPPWLDQI
jgi:broad specificity phosphatase PhoE